MSIIHQIGYKLRVQIEKFSGELSFSFGKVLKRFVSEMVYGILSSGSVRLTRISRMLEESITVHKTHDRLCRNLHHKRLERELERGVLSKASSYFNKDTLLVIDPTDIIKPYARKMEYLTEVRDGSQKSIGNGYWLCQAIGVNQASGKIIPLVNRLYSSTAPDFISENDHILEITENIFKFTNHQGIIVMDRGGDRVKLLSPWTRNEEIDYIIRQRGDRHLLYRRGKHLCSDLAKYCDTPYSETVTKIKDGKTRTYQLSFGFLPVRLPAHKKRQLYLVVVKGLGKDPLMLLTTLNMRRNRKIIWRIVQDYIARWRIEETIRYIKQSYNIEDVRLLTYQRLKNLMNLVLAASFFTCVYLGINERLKILVGHALKAAKRLFGIPDFNYYSISDGIKAILTRCAMGINKKKPPDLNSIQRKLFNY
jgi:hypothetical protein